MNLLAKLPNDGSADPLSIVYDIDLTIPADKVVRLIIMIKMILLIVMMIIIIIVVIMIKKCFMFFPLQAGLSHTATDVVNSTLGIFNNNNNNNKQQQLPN